MFAELFFADNLLMDLIALRLAAAMLSVRCPPRRAFAFALAAAVAAACAFPLEYQMPFPVKLLVPALMAFALPARGLPARLGAVLALFASFFAEGGAAVAAAFMLGGIGSGITPAQAALGAAFAAGLPIIIRRLLARRVPEGMALRLEAGLAPEGGGPPIRIECAALVDTGCSVTEPLSALPVVILPEKRFPTAAKRAGIPIPIRTANGAGVIYALRPRYLTVDGRPAEALIAFMKTRTALAPPCLASGAQGTEKGGNYAEAHPKTDREAV